MTVRDWGMFALHHGDCLDVLRGMADNSVDSVVTDPPYGIRFMGAAWDRADIEARHGARAAMKSHAPNAGPNGGYKSIAAEAGKYDLSPDAMVAFEAFTKAWATEAFRVLKPGGHLLSFASTRTFHRMVCGVEAAGFELRDIAMWVFGSGFPKSHNGPWGGTALKPAWEPICMARKPLIGTGEANWREHGTGALNIDGCRVGGNVDEMRGRSGTAALPGGNTTSYRAHNADGGVWEPHNAGRWPANLIHDGSDEVLAAFPQAPGQLADASSSSSSRKTQNVYGAMRRGRGDEASADSDNEGTVGFKMKPGARRLDAGSAARFFYCAKASKSDRGEGNTHPTVKPTDLMRYLCSLVTPAGGLVLDPFAGSGSTGKGAALAGLRFVGVERDLAYVDIAERRIATAYFGRSAFGEAT